jgi:hypothetical protein
LEVIATRLEVVAAIDGSEGLVDRLRLAPGHPVVGVVGHGALNGVADEIQELHVGEQPMHPLRHAPKRWVLRVIGGGLPERLGRLSKTLFVPGQAFFIAP